MIRLLDVNVLVALSIREHVFHDVAQRWFAQRDGGFATCPITEGGLVRMLTRNGIPATAALKALEALGSRHDHEFWPDDRSYTEISMSSVVGHRQVTDAYLAGLARFRGGRIATFDAGLASTHNDVAVLVPKD